MYHGPCSKDKSVHLSIQLSLSSYRLMYTSIDTLVHSRPETLDYLRDRVKKYVHFLEYTHVRITTDFFSQYPTKFGILLFQTPFHNMHVVTTLASQKKQRCIQTTTFHFSLTNRTREWKKISTVLSFKSVVR